MTDTFRIMAAWPMCNREPATAPNWRGGCAPLCWCCLALSAGVVVGAALPLPATTWLMLPLLVPCLIDGGCRHLVGWRSSNRLRVVTGVPAGIDLILLARSLAPLLS